MDSCVFCDLLYSIHGLIEFRVKAEGISFIDRIIANILILIERVTCRMGQSKCKQCLF